MTNRFTSIRGGDFQADYSALKLGVLIGVAAILFIIGLIVTERTPEIPVDIDWKPFFLIYLLLALLPWGTPSISIALGAAFGEGALDALEGYETDDPFGFVGYVIGFAIAGYVFRDRATDSVKLATGAVLGAFIQALFEGAALLLIDDQSLAIAAYSVLGNTVTHGVLLGALPLIPLVWILHGKAERFLGFVPKDNGDEPGRARKSS